MAFAPRGLLDRLRSLMALNVAIIDDKYVEDSDILRLIDVRRIPESMELIRVLYTWIRGSNAAASATDQQPLLPASGHSYWVREMVNAAARLKQRDEDALTKAYWDLLDILQLTKRTIADQRYPRYRIEKQITLIRRIRHLPDAYREFYGLVDNML